MIIKPVDPVPKSKTHPYLIVPLPSRMPVRRMRPLGPTPISIGILALALMILQPSLIQGQHPAPYFEGERIVVDARVNGRPVHFVFDTGASFSAIFSRPANAFGLATDLYSDIKVGNHKIRLGATKELDLDMLGKSTKVRLAVVPFEGAVDCEGVLGWRDLTVSHLLLDGFERRVSTPNHCPESGWQKWKLDKSSSQLFFHVSEGDRELGRVFVDTGSMAGLRVAPDLWQAWISKHPEGRRSFESSRSLFNEQSTTEVAWADSFQLGDLHLFQLDVGPLSAEKSEKTLDVDGHEYIAMIGARGLRYLKLLVSPGTEEVYSLSVHPYSQHNRLGAAFIWDDKLAEYRCRTLPGSPAEHAGLRPGDRLIAINETPCTELATSVDPNEFFSRPVGTKIVLKIERDGEQMTVEVTLQNLLP